MRLRHRTGQAALQLCALAAVNVTLLVRADSTWQQTATGPAYGGESSPTGDDVWVSCNPTTGYDSLGGGCVLNKHTGLYTHDPNARDGSFYSSTNSHFGGSVEVPEGGGIGTEESPARACADLAKLPHFASGDYWLRPDASSDAFLGYCDLDSFGGGWLMCYATSRGVHVSQEVSSEVGYPSNGYRSDCRNYPFNQVLYVEHDIRTGAASDDKAWFSFRGRNALVASRSGFSGSVSSSWAAGLGETGILFDGKGFASTRTPQCQQERANGACRQPLVADSKVQECPDCYSVRPQIGNATCSSSDVSNCWCDGLATGGCSSDGNPKHTLTLAAANAAVKDFYAGWVITITSGTGTGQSKRIMSSEGGTCSSASYSTRATCLANGGSWGGGANTVTAESVWETLPCSNSKLDGYRCQAECSPTFPGDGSSCNHEVVYDTEANCQAGCKAFDPYLGTSSIDWQGFHVGSTATLDGNVDASTVELTVDDATAATIAQGKSIKIDDEMMYVTQVTGNVVRLVRGVNQTSAASHSDNAAVQVVIDYSVNSAPTCSRLCTTSYRLDAPHECTPLDWACGYGEAGGVRRGYQPEQGSCAVPCACDTAGTPTCGDGSGTCSCRASINPHGTSIASPWHTSIVRMASGANLDGCSGPFDKCRGSNPYAGYRLTIGGQTRTIVGYSGHYKVVQLDAPLASAPVPAPASDTTWSGAAGYSMKLADGCLTRYDNDLEKRACAETQLYELMICDDAAGTARMAGGFIMTGYDASKGCRKTCEDLTWCEDHDSEWYRADTGRAEASGVAFKTPGHRALPLDDKILSVGIR
jgi:hypothetical protein